MRSDPSSRWVRIPPCSESPGAECFDLTVGAEAGSSSTERCQFEPIRGGGAASGFPTGRCDRGPSSSRGGIARATATTEVVVQATATPDPKPIVPSAVSPTQTPPTPVPTTSVPPTAVPPTTIPPTPAPTELPARSTPAAPTPTNTPEPAVAALPSTPETGSTTAVFPPMVAEQAGGFPAGLIAAIVVAVIIAGGLGFGVWRMLRPQ